MATIDLDALRKEVEADRKALAEKEAVLRFFEGRQVYSATQAPLLPDVVVDKDLISLDQLIPDGQRRTLQEDVKDIISRFGTQEFSVAHVDAALKKMGVEIKGGKFPRSRISTTLGKLESQGFIAKTFEGSGNVPNRYRLNNADDLL
ncbi:MAG: hypothetical protein M0Q22_08270 [Sulfuritalea sp.]|jgi:hypothetical protein|nr:hypothetical protein [Sulfuritalea sp.]